MVVVTGGSGFIGSHLLKRIKGFDFSLGKGFDVRDSDLVLKETKGADAIVHLAAVTDAASNDIEEIFGINVHGTLNVLEACRKNDIRKLVFSSSAAVYGDAKPPLNESMHCKPINLYGASKLASESYISAYASSYGLDATMFRFFNVYGPCCKGVVRTLIRASLDKKSIVIEGDGKQTRDFVYVDDVVDVMVKALSRKGLGPYNIGTGIETTINELATKISELGGKLEIKHDLPRKNDIKKSFADVSRASAAGFKANTSLGDGLKETFRFFRK
jgi:UDP-glucose 4-epimerase